MEFRLVYEGQLKAAGSSNSRVPEKHAIRKQLHLQLAELWKEHPQLKVWNASRQSPFQEAPKIPESLIAEFDEIEDDGDEWMLKLLKGMDAADERRKVKWDKGRLAEVGKTYVETLGDRYARNDFRFVPLVQSELKLVCSLDVLFLRREKPGAIIDSSGDIDNRIKVLFDALRIPKDGSELRLSPTKTAVPDANEQPFFCLLEDDSLITEINIKTDRLLKPFIAGSHPSDVMLIMNVGVKSLMSNMHNMLLI